MKEASTANNYDYINIRAFNKQWHAFFLYIHSHNGQRSNCFKNISYSIIYLCSHGMVQQYVGRFQISMYNRWDSL